MPDLKLDHSVKISKDTAARVIASSERMGLPKEEVFARDVETGVRRHNWNKDYFASPKGQRAIKRARKAKAGKA